MSFPLYDYMNKQGENEIKIWLSSLEKVERAKIDQRLDMLEEHGENLFPQILTGTDEKSILKLRAHGKVQLRPLLCRGPVSNAAEYTLLAGAKEVGSKLTPKGVLAESVQRRRAVIQDPTNRRKNHERKTK